MNSLLFLFFLVIIGCVWYDSMKARERVIRHCHRLCKEAGVQLLDQTIAMVSLSLKRVKHRGLVLQRIYQFEVSEDGANRLSGFVIFAAGQIIESRVETPEGNNIFHEPRRDH